MLGILRFVPVIRRVEARIGDGKVFLLCLMIHEHTHKGHFSFLRKGSTPREYTDLPELIQPC